MSILSIETRRAVSTDSQGIANVHDVSWRQAYGGLIPYKSLDAMVRRRGEQWWARAIRHSTRILVLEDKSKPVRMQV